MPGDVDGNHAEFLERRPGGQGLAVYRSPIYSAPQDSIIPHGGVIAMFKNGMRPIHPGEILREEYLVPLGLSANALARALGVTTARVNDIVRERRGITGDTALRLARYFGTDAQSWLNLQAAYELRRAEIETGKAIERAVKPRAA